MLIEFISLGAIAEALREYIGSQSAISLQRGRLIKNFRQKGSPPPTILLVTKLGKWFFMWYKNGGTTFVSSQIKRSTDRQTDRRTDRQTEFSSLDRVCIPCSALKNNIGQSILRKIIQTVATRCQILRLKCNKSISSGAVLQALLGAYRAHPDPLTGIKGT